MLARYRESHKVDLHNILCLQIVLCDKRKVGARILVCVFSNAFCQVFLLPLHINKIGFLTCICVLKIVIESPNKLKRSLCLWTQPEKNNATWEKRERKPVYALFSFLSHTHNSHWWESDHRGKEGATSKRKGNRTALS